MKPNRILVFVAAALLACSCNYLLEKSPLGSLAVENYYTTEDEVNTAVLGVYHVFMTENCPPCPMPATIPGIRTGRW